MGRKWHGSGIKTPQLEVTSSPGVGKYLRDDGTGLFLPVSTSQIATDLNLSTTYQPIDSDLTAIAALATTSYGRSKLELVDAAGERLAVHGRDVQYGSAKPALRSTGVTLAVGDHWYDTTATANWWNVWDGSRWLTHQVFNSDVSLVATGATTGISIGETPTSTFSIAAIDLRVNIVRIGTIDASNHWTVQTQRVSSSFGLTQIGSTLTFNTTLASGIVDVLNGVNTINTVYALSGNAGFRILLTKVGTPNSAGGGILSSATFRFRYRYAYA